MKIVHINATDVGGGAAIACTRHCEAMLKAGLEATMVVSSKYSRKDYVKYPHWGLCGLFRVFYRLIHDKFIKRLNPVGNFSMMCFGMPFYKNPDVRNSDVIFIHWINGNALSIKGVEKILRLGKPVFWYMHDMFPITGGCHHSLGCEGYKDNCKNCPLITNSRYNSVASEQLRKKIKHWSKYDNLHFVTPSTWLGNCVRNSCIAVGHTIDVVTNILNTDIYKPMAIDAKNIFGLDPQKRTILFGAAALNSVYKGTQFAHDCLKMLDPNVYQGIVIGNANKEFVSDLDISIIETGFLSDDLSLALAYNACDTFIISSIAENYPNVVLEAMSCGKPCVGFKTGGIPDLIKHKKTGYLTEENTAEELLKGLEWIFEDADRYKELSIAARKQILSNNSYQKVMNIHTELNQYAK